MHDVLLLVKDLNLYFYSLISTCDCAAVYPGGKLEADARILEWKQTNKFDVADLGDWKDKLKQYKLIVFMDFGYETYLSEYVKTQTDARVVLFLWNAVDKEKIDLLERIAKSGSVDDVYTFDPIDASKYQLKYNTTFYYPDIPHQTYQEIYDVYFGGTDKNRGKLILETKKLVEHFGMKFLLHCPGLEGSVSEEYVKYPEYLKMTLQSKSLLEILKEGQTGISLRSMESLFFQKKLITQNTVIKYYKFYHPHNVFILGEDDIETLPIFMQTPYQKIDDDIVSFFEFDAWLKRFSSSSVSMLEEYAFAKKGINLRA